MLLLYAENVNLMRPKYGQTGNLPDRGETGAGNGCAGGGRAANFYRKKIGLVIPSQIMYNKVTE